MKEETMSFKERKEAAETLEYYFDQFSSNSNYNNNNNDSSPLHLSIKCAKGTKAKDKNRFQTHIINRSNFNLKFDIDKPVMITNTPLNLEFLLHKRGDNIKGILNHYIKANQLRKIDINKIEDNDARLAFDLDCKCDDYKDHSKNYERKMTDYRSATKNKLLQKKNNGNEYKVNNSNNNSNDNDKHVFNLVRIKEPSLLIDSLNEIKEEDKSINDTIPSSVNKFTTFNDVVTSSPILKQNKTLIKQHISLPLKDNDYNYNRNSINKCSFKQSMSHQSSSLFNANNWKEEQYRKLRLDNAMIYDSLSDDEDENEEIRGVIHPESPLIFIWDIWIISIMIYYVTLIPSLIAFFDDDIIYIVILDLIINFSLITDMILYFFLPYPKKDNETYQTKPKDIVINYVLGWFFVDFLSAIPFSSIFHFQRQGVIVYHQSNAYAIPNHHQPHRILKLLPLIKLFKLVYYNKQKKKRRSNDSILFFWIPIYIRRICSFFFVLVMISHILGSVWCYIGQYDYYNWIIKANLQDKSYLDIYSASLYFILTSVFTTGYGDITAVNYREREYAVFLMILGLFLYTYIVSSIMILFRKSNKEKRLDHYINVLDNIKIQYKVNTKLYWKIRKFITYENEANRDEQMNLINSFSYSMQNILFTEMHTDVLNFKFFNDTNGKFKAKVIMHLKPLFASRGNILVKTNDIIDELIFVKRGRLELEYCYGKKVIKISKIFRGEHFGEINMIMNKRSNYDIVVKSKCAELLLLNKQILIEICNEFPDFLDKIKQKSLLNYNLFAAKLNKRIAYLKQISIMNKEKKLKALKHSNICIYDENYEYSHITNDDNDNDNEESNSFFISQCINKNCIETIKEEEEDENIINLSNSCISNKEQMKKDSIDKDKFSFKSNSLLDNNNTPKNNNNNSQNSPTRLKPTNSFSPVNKTMLGKKTNSFKSIDKPIIQPPFHLRKFSNRTYHTEKSKGTRSKFHRSSLFQNNKVGDEEGGFVRMRHKNSYGSARSLFNFTSFNNNNQRLRVSKSKIKRDTIIINQNIIDDSLKINEPKMFYSNVFEKWKIEDQNQRLVNVYKKIVEYRNIQQQSNKSSKSKQSIN